MSMNCTSPLGKIRSVVIICCLILVVSIFGYAYLVNTNADVIDKDTLVANIEAMDEDSTEYSYVSSYLKNLGIKNINSYKINAIESLLESDFYTELPEKKALAKETALLFVEYYYDTTDLEDKEAVTDGILYCLFASIDDPYAFYRNAEEFNAYSDHLAGTDSEFVGIGVMTNVQTHEIIMVYPGSGAEEAGIKCRDVVYAIEGVVITDENYEEVFNSLKGEPGTTVEVTVKRQDSLLTFTVTRRKLTERSVYHFMTEENVGHIEIIQFLDNTPEQFIESVEFCIENGATALVLDLRYNPGGIVDAATEIIDYIVPDADGRKIAYYNYKGSEYTYYTVDGHSIDLPIALIVNEHSASAAELFAAAIRDFNDQGVINAVIVGDTTYGKGVVQNNYHIYDNSGVTFTISYMFPPSEEVYDGIGIIPDIEVGEVDGEDLPLSVAIDEALKLINSNSDVTIGGGVAA